MFSYVSFSEPEDVGHGEFWSTYMKKSRLFLKPDIFTKNLSYWDDPGWSSANVAEQKHLFILWVFQNNHTGDVSYLD